MQLEGLAQPVWLTQFGANVVYIADSKETTDLMRDEGRMGLGAFALAFPSIVTGTQMTSAPTPVSTLETLIASLRLQDALQSEIEPVSVNGAPAALVDVDRDPLGTLVERELRPRFRIILAFPPESEAPFLFLLGATESTWNGYLPLFDQMLASVSWQLEVVDVAPRRVLRGPVSPEESVTGLLGNEQTDLWTFAGQADQYVTLALNPVGTDVDLTLSLLLPSGELLEQADFGLPGDPEIILDALLPVPGEYVVEVAEFFGESGRYELSLTQTASPQFVSGGVIAPGEVVSSELVAATRPVWSFDGEAGQLISIVLTPVNEQLDLLLELTGPEGELLIERDETFAGDPEVLAGYELPSTGRYQIHIRSFAEQSGSYSLALDEGGEDTANYYDAGDLVYGNVEQEALMEDEVHAWFFEGQAGDEVTILTTPLADNLDLDIWLLDPQLRRAAQKDETLSGEAELIEITLPEAGPYTILVREFFGEPGDYEIAISAKGYDNLEDVGELTYGQSVTGNLLPGKGDVWRFSGEVDDEIDLFLTPSDQNGDLVLLLLDPEGNEAAQIDLNLAGAPEQLRGFRLPAAGTWAIVIREFFNEGGPYQLTLNRVEPTN